MNTTNTAPARSAWEAVCQDPDGSEETEVVFLEGVEVTEPGAVLETTAGLRITLTRPAGETETA